MSKLTERIRQARRRGGRQLGFGASNARTAASRGLLIAAQGGGVEGADIVVVPEADAIGAAGGSPGTLVGVEIAPLTAAAAEAADRGGADFVLYDPEQAQAEALMRERLDYVLRLPDRSLDEDELRAIATLRPALVVAGAVSGALSVLDLIALRRLALLIGAPLALPVPSDASGELLQILRDSGVVVVVLDSPSAEAVAALRERIAALPLGQRRDDDDVSPTLPSLPGAGVGDDDFDDDDGRRAPGP